MSTQVQVLLSLAAPWMDHRGVTRNQSHIMSPLYYLAARFFFEFKICLTIGNGKKLSLSCSSPRCTGSKNKWNRSHPNKKVVHHRLTPCYYTLLAHFKPIFLQGKAPRHLSRKSLQKSIRR
ncbi:hypothetical protein CEXT_566371 [Caerostris extrusa]|uniref:Uncharacterized protein n=1 Tax=Caerostris extrusa TaxID=172846 RepID=A0AAV4SEI0_CAEEX|nr:hypothetical protein CEXT_566371 [Caerostris extrusa]